MIEASSPAAEASTAREIREQRPELGVPDAREGEQGTSLLHLPYPQDLPGDLGALARAVGEVPIHMPVVEALRNRSAIAAVEWRALAAGAHEGGQPRDAATRAEAGYREHDRYFRVVRVAAEPASAFARGLFLAHSAALDNALETGVVILDEGEWRNLFAGLRLVFDPSGGDPGATGDVAIPPPAHPQGYDAEERWLLGHRLFFVLIQGVIVGINRFLAGHAAEDGDGAAQGLELAATFLRSSAISFKFASDFDPAVYDRQVRPAMAPPAVGEGFSGLQTRDHSHLVRRFGEVKRALAGTSAPFPAAESFVDALVETFLAHQLICARFGGTVLPSLRMAARAKQANESSPRAGVDVIRELARSRLLSVTDRPPDRAP